MNLAIYWNAPCRCRSWFYNNYNSSKLDGSRSDIETINALHFLAKVWWRVAFNEALWTSSILSMKDWKDWIHVLFRRSITRFWLVVWNMNFICPYIGNFINPTDFHIFQGVQTTNQNCSSWNQHIYAYFACPPQRFWVATDDLLDITRREKGPCL